VRVLLVGSGGREHAIGWKLIQSDRVNTVTSLPGNPGLATIGPIIEGIDINDAEAIASIAQQLKFDLVVIGPEAPMAAGVSDALTALGIRTFAPSKYAAQLESSKTFAKAIMDRSGVPTAQWWRFTESGAAFAHLANSPGPYVVKADGLAAGKGVLVTTVRSEAEAWVMDCLNGKFGEAGTSIVIEEFLDGPEISVFAVCDGTDAVMLEPARDYKLLKSGNAGPNTGGMGSFSPVSDLPPGLIEFTKTQVVRPVMQTMAADGHPFVGVLYTGFVLTSEGPKVLEFNCRLGDPETQVILPRLETDLLDIIESALDGRIGNLALIWSDIAAVNIVLTAHGYPEQPRKGDRIRGAESTDALVFHGGTADQDGVLVTNGGRVLNVVGTGSNVAEARHAAYAAASQITWNGKQYRNDIAGAQT
jgi:phosphoribosylamine--glycine ligase